MSTLRSVPVRRIFSGAAKPETPRFFRSLSPAPPSSLPVFGHPAATGAADASSSADQSQPPASQQQQQQVEGAAVATSGVSLSSRGGVVIEPSPARSAASQSSKTPQSTVPNTNNQAAAVVAVNLDNFEVMPAIRGVLNSPRSLKVCEKLQIHPSELVQRPLNDFLAHGVPRSVALLRREHFEKQRLEKVETLRRARLSMPSQPLSPPAGSIPSHHPAAFSSSPACLSVPASIQEMGAEPPTAATADHQGAAATPQQNKTAVAAAAFGFSKNKTRSSAAVSSGGAVFASPATAHQLQRTGSRTHTPRQSSARAATPPSRSRSAQPAQNTTSLVATNKSNNNNNSSVSVHQRSATSLSRNNTSASAMGEFRSTHTLRPVELSSPARDNHLRMREAREQHRSEIAARAKMEQRAKDLHNVQRIAQQQRAKEVTMRRMLRDRLIDSERKRLELEDSLAHAARQRRAKELEAERERLGRLRHEQGGPRADKYMVLQAKADYRSPAQRRFLERSHSAHVRSSSAGGGSRSGSAQQQQQQLQQGIPTNPGASPGWWR